jgi:hypothetical protein
VTRTRKSRAKPKPRIGSLEFKQLQKKWYAKLEAEGFKDLEYHEGPLVDSLLKGKSREHLRVKLGNSIYQFYFLLRNFLAHNPHFWSAYQPGEINKRFIVLKFTEGLTYREIAKQSKSLKTPFSHYVAFKVSHEFITIALEWNKTHPQGYENCNTDMDFYLDDIALRDHEED